MRALLAILGFFFAWGIIKLRTQEGFFVPLPMSTVREMLKLASVKNGDVLYDLGSGDGRVVVEAARRYGIHAVGVENGALLYILSKLGVKLRRLDGKIKLVNKDFFKVNIRDADVVAIYLTPKLVNQLKPKFERELKKGVRVVSAAHEIKGWKPLRKIKTGHFWTYLYKI